MVSIIFLADVAPAGKSNSGSNQVKLRRGTCRKTDLTAKYAKYAKAEATDSNFQTVIGLIFISRG
jgi:hypothetical protein